MNRDIARLRPAEVVEARPIPRVQDIPLETWTGQRWELKARLEKAVRRGEIAEASAWHALPGAPGWFAVKVRRLKRPAPAWRSWAIGAAAVMTVVCGLGAAAFFLMPVWLGYVLMVGGASLAAGGAALWVRNRFGRGGNVTINQTVNVRR